MVLPGSLKFWTSFFFCHVQWMKYFFLIMFFLVDDVELDECADGT
jgi:hypothetical protein